MAQMKRRRRKEHPKQETAYYTSSGKDKPGLDVKYINSDKGRGVFSSVPFDEGDFLLEYRGQLISKPECDRRQKFRFYGGLLWLFLRQNPSTLQQQTLAIIEHSKQNVAENIKEVTAVDELEAADPREESEKITIVKDQSKPKEQDSKELCKKTEKINSTLMAVMEVTQSGADAENLDASLKTPAQIRT